VLLILLGNGGWICYFQIHIMIVLPLSQLKRPVYETSGRAQIACEAEGAAAALRSRRAIIRKQQARLQARLQGQEGGNEEEKRSEEGGEEAHTQASVKRQAVQTGGSRRLRHKGDTTGAPPKAHVSASF
jgi:hypothetical protein